MRDSTPVETRKLGTILGVWAHPDDESWSSAGIMAAAVANGQTVVCVTATKGEQGVQDADRWPPPQLGDIRSKELAAALRVLGVSHHHWLGYADGHCAQVPMAEAVGKIKDFIKRYQPDTILTFGPEGLTGHPDHQAVSRWAGEAAKGTGITVYHAVQVKEWYDRLRQVDEQFNIFFNIDQPPLVAAADCDLLMRLPQDLQDKKYRCLCAMPSQTEAMFKRFDRESVCDMLCCEAFVRAK